MGSERENTLREIELWRISAIIRADDQRLAADAMTAAIAGGFRIAEFTLTTPGALNLISTFSANHQDVVVGAGTVMNGQQARNAVDSGARFVVSPVCDPDVMAVAGELDVVTIPGTFSPTEMLAAHRQGADLVKLFPAPADVAQYVAWILGPMPYLKIFPTAGVDEKNMIEVLHAGAAGVGFVGSLFRPVDLARGDFKAIETRAAFITGRLGELS